MNKESLKKIAACVSAAALSVSMLTACGNQKTAELAEGAVTSLSDEETQKVALKVNDTEISAGELQYYIYNAAMMTIYKIDKNFNGDLTNFDWDQKVDGKPIEEAILNTAIDNAAADCVTIEKGKENGISLSDDEMSQVETSISSYISQNGEEMFNLSMNSMAINGADDYKKLYSQIVGAQKADEDIQNNFDKYAPDKDKLKKYKSDKKVTVQHILIQNNSEKQENPEEAINSVLERAKAGEDFVALMNEFNEDPGETEAGYTFGPGEMVKEFEDAAFALDYDQISDVVKSDYGYHIIKRLVGTAELTNMWVDEAKISKNEKVLKGISVRNILKAAENASQKAQEMQSAASAAASGSETQSTDENTDGNGDAGSNG